MVVDLEDDAIVEEHFVEEKNTAPPPTLEPLDDEDRDSGRGSGSVNSADVQELIAFESAPGLWGGGGTLNISNVRRGVAAL